jgi:hypothetical protein
MLIEIGNQYQHHLRTRIQHAITQSPIKGILHTGVDWQPEVIDREKKGKKLCQHVGICDHTRKHWFRTARNGLVIMDMLKNSPQVGNFLIPKLFSDTQTTFIMLSHDLGYGTDRPLIEGLDVTNHEAESVRMLHHLTTELPFFHPSRRQARKFRSFYEEAIAGTLDHADDIVAHVANTRQNPTPKNLFSLLVAAADKSDYFIHDRVKDLQAPREYTDNPYYFLAAAVEDYQLIYNEQARALQMIVSMRGGTSVSDFPRWKHELETGAYKSVIQLLSGTAQLAGNRFEIIEAR